MKRPKLFLIISVLILLVSCNSQVIEQPSPANLPQTTNLATPVESKSPLKTIEKIAMGETIYVPIYLEIYYAENRTFNLTATLSIRNTDLVNPIILSSVRYYDGDGKLVKQYLDCARKIEPLASLKLLAATTKPTTSFGTSFIVEWVAEQTVNSPIIEGVMLSTTSGQGISFTSVGRVIQNPKTSPVKLCQ
jgi:hypothetical protein